MDTPSEPKKPKLTLIINPDYEAMTKPVSSTMAAEDYKVRLSGSMLAAFQWLLERIHSPKEIFSEALRVLYMLRKAHENGIPLYAKRDDGTEVPLFVVLENREDGGT